MMIEPDPKDVLADTAAHMAEASERLTERLDEERFWRRRETWWRRLVVVLVAGVLILLAFAIRPVVRDTRQITADTNTVVNETVAARDKTIADQKIVINQAVYYVTLMARQIATLGGTPPEILLDPARGEPPPP